MRPKLLTLMGLMLVLNAMAWAQSGAPNLIRCQDWLIDAAGQPITQPTPIRIQIIQGGTPDEMPSSGRVVFEERATVRPDGNGWFEHMIGSNARGPIGRQGFDAEDLNTSSPVYVEVAIVAETGTGVATFEVLLPRQRLTSTAYALQAQHAADAAVDDRFVNIDGDSMSGPLRIQSSLQVGSGGPTLGPGDAFVAGTLQVGATSLVLNTNGIRFPDTTFQSTAGIAPDQVVKSVNGLMGNLTLAQGPHITITPSGNMLTIAAPNALTSVANNATLFGTGTSGFPLGVAVPLRLAGHDIYGGIVRGHNEALYGAGVLGTSEFDVGVEGLSDTGIGVRAECLSGELFRGASGGFIRFIVDNDGDVFAKSYQPLSDAGLKTDIQPLLDVLEKVKQIRGVSYEWIEERPSRVAREIGVIAQEVEPVFPELVKPWGDQGYKGVSYDGLTAVLVEAVKVLARQNDELRAELQSLKRVVAAQKDASRK